MVLVRWLFARFDLITQEAPPTKPVSALRGWRELLRALLSDMTLAAALWQHACPFFLPVLDNNVSIDHDHKLDEAA